MAHSSKTPQHDFSSNSSFLDVDDIEADMDPPVPVYGAVSGSAPMLRVKSSSGEGDADDIPLHDFQLERPKEPLISAQSTRTAFISTVRPSVFTSTHSLSSATSHSGYSDYMYNQDDSWVYHPKVRENCRLVVAAGSLMVLGIILIIAGIGVALSPATGYHCIVIIVVGLLCVIPGGYHFIYIYCAAIGRPGFDFNNLPVLR